jgi:ribose transport system permease protein
LDTKETFAPRLVNAIRNVTFDYRVEIGIFFAFMILCVALSFLTPRFLSVGNIGNLFWQATTLGIVAIGQTFVILTAGIDLSVGGNMAFSAMLGGLVLLKLGFVAGIPAILLTGILVGLVNGYLISYGQLAPFIVTLGVASITRSLTYVVSDAHSLVNLPIEYKFFGYARAFGIPLYIIILISFFVIGHIVLTRTKLGVFLYAVGSNEEAARLAGVNVKLNRMVAYMITGFLSAMAVIILTSRLGAIDPDTGTGMELDTIAAVVIGGCSLFGGKGSLVGTFIGIFLITVLHNGLNLLGVSPFWQGSAVGTVVIASVLIDRVLRRRR